MLAMYFHKKQHSTKVTVLHRPIFRENLINEIWKSDYRLDRLGDLPVEALDWDLDEFCFVSEKKIHLCICSCWVKERLCCLSLIWLVYLKCKFLRTKTLHRAPKSAHPALSKTFVHYTHTTASTRVNGNTHSWGDTVILPLTTLYSERRDRGTNWFQLFRS